MTTKTKVTKAQATRVLRAVEKRFGAWLDGNENDPKLLMDFEWGYWGYSTPAVVWEGGPYDWTIAFTGGGLTDEERAMEGEIKELFGATVKHKQPEPAKVEGVFLEPITGWALGIYPDW